MFSLQVTGDRELRSVNSANSCELRQQNSTFTSRSLIVERQGNKWHI